MEPGMRINSCVMSLLLILVLSGCGNEAQNAENMVQVTRLQRIAFGSCISQSDGAALLRTVVAADPDLFLLIGDVIYPDLRDDGTAPLDPWPNDNPLERISQVYAQLSAKAVFQNLRESIPIMAVWDDHDFGTNDGSSNFPLKEETQRLFLDFFEEPQSSERRATPGVYDARTFGPDGERVQIIMLDTRYFRTPPLPDIRSKEEKIRLNISGRYTPNNDPAATVLGDVQWRWLAEQLHEPADIRLIISSYPLISNEMGRDSWGNMPLERQRFFDLIESEKANGVIILSGDVHFAEISETDEGPYRLLDFTSSPLAAPSRGNDRFTNSHRVSTAFVGTNFGLVEIDWEAKPVPVITLKAIGLDGEAVFEHRISLEQLRATTESVF